MSTSKSNTMVTYTPTPVTIQNGAPVEIPAADPAGREQTLAYRILRAHSRAPAKGNGSGFAIGFDALISHDITYVGIIQTARASGLTEFPLPYVLTNCHNSLCAVGGTINADDHVFGLSAAVKYGGIFVPANLAVIHNYARERLCKCGAMILGSDSHTRYGCFGALGVGEGGGELVKQLLQNTWDVAPPEVVLVWLEGRLKRGVGPHDVAIALVGECFPEGRVKNRILEFAGPGVKNLSMDFRAGIDVMTTETSCLSSVWETDETVREYYDLVKRPGDFSALRIADGAAYDAVVRVDLSAIECMAALPFHPSKAITVHELKEKGINPDQGIIAGCAGGLYENIAEAAAILEGGDIGSGGFELSVYPGSAPIALALSRDGTAAKLTARGAVVKPAFCGPCFGAGDTPANGSFSVRHTTRNFPNREGSKPSEGQAAYVALMDARSIAATARNGGVLTAATDVDYEVPAFHYTYDDSMYKSRVYEGFGRARPGAALRFGPNIADWPQIPALSRHLLLKVCAVLHDEVTTTDELIPSGETSSYRSNPLKLAEFTLSRREPDYVNQCRDVKPPANFDIDATDTTVGSCIFARKPGDGSAREQAASCQKVLGGFGNIAYEYATKRYRSNCINWGIVPFTIEREFIWDVGAWIYIPDLRAGILNGQEFFPAKVFLGEHVSDIMLTLKDLDPEERQILADGCLMNHYANRSKHE
ncbi:MAG: aconitase family protein [Firmicutes bacterium]|nr:aconitase family protein [Bacillota bacterium]